MQEIHPIFLHHRRRREINEKWKKKASKQPSFLVWNEFARVDKMNEIIGIYKLEGDIYFLY